eukprot:2566302-Prymnesium_polylepis.1
MQIGRRYVDGRDGSSGVQFINTDLAAPTGTNEQCEICIDGDGAGDGTGRDRSRFFSIPDV